MELKIGDWVKVRGRSRVYVVEGMVTPKGSIYPNMIRLNGMKYRQNVRDVIEIRRVPTYLHVTLGPTEK